MAKHYWEGVYGPDFMDKVPESVKKSLSLPDTHDLYGEPKAIRDAKGKAAESARQ